MPPMDGMPGQSVPAEFLDFLIGQSPPGLKHIYRSGFDALNAEARKSYHKSFAEVDGAQAHALLQPLREPWTYELPADRLKRCLVMAKVDVTRISGWMRSRFLALTIRPSHSIEYASA